MGFLKMTGGALNSVEIIPTEVLEHLGCRVMFCEMVGSIALAGAPSTRKICAA